MTSESVFTLTEIDTDVVTDTIMKNAPDMIEAGIAIFLVVLAFKMIPRLFKSFVRG